MRRTLRGSDTNLFQTLHLLRIAFARRLAYPLRVVTDPVCAPSLLRRTHGVLAGALSPHPTSPARWQSLHRTSLLGKPSLTSSLITRHDQSCCVVFLPRRCLPARLLSQYAPLAMPATTVACATLLTHPVRLTPLLYLRVIGRLAFSVHRNVYHLAYPHSPGHLFGAGFCPSLLLWLSLYFHSQPQLRYSAIPPKCKPDLREALMHTRHTYKMHTSNTSDASSTAFSPSHLPDIRPAWPYAQRPGSIGTSLPLCLLPLHNAQCGSLLTLYTAAHLQQNRRPAANWLFHCFALNCNSSAALSSCTFCGSPRRGPLTYRCDWACGSAFAVLRPLYWLVLPLDYRLSCVPAQFWQPNIATRPP